ncbi:hypothetical protein BDW22DRAFT_1349362 [Trametopsis cervina]|nr:hypothetical protein BDW22DRAFT_1349362 [Trametopsis cervina]
MRHCLPLPTTLCSTAPTPALAISGTSDHDRRSLLRAASQVQVMPRLMPSLPPANLAHHSFEPCGGAGLRCVRSRRAVRSESVGNIKTRVWGREGGVMKQEESSRVEGVRALLLVCMRRDFEREVDSAVLLVGVLQAFLWNDVGHVATKLARDSRYTWAPPSSSALGSNTPESLSATVGVCAALPEGPRVATMNVLEAHRGKRVSNVEVHGTLDGHYSIADQLVYRIIPMLIKRPKGTDSHKHSMGESSRDEEA